MDKKLSVLLIIPILAILFIGNVVALEKNNGNGYGIQWQHEYGTEWETGARFQGPQPIGDCDNDGKNELLIGGMDPNLRVMKWDEGKKTYVQTRVLHPPFYPFIKVGCGGYAIGDLTGDEKNEIAATWDTAVYRYFMGRYLMIGMNSWILRHGGGSADCYIGDCDNDGKNELIVSGGPWSENSTVPLITILKWNGWRLVKVASWDNNSSPPRPDAYRYVYMSGFGDVDDDGLNEIVCSYANKVFVLKWNTQHHAFDSTVIFDYPYDPNNSSDEPFSVVCKDCDNDGKAEIVVGYFTPHIIILKWNGTEYVVQADMNWPNNRGVIEGIDVGDVNNDGKNEVCVGTGVVHILQWNGSDYVEQAVLPTYGLLSVVSIGDCDNDGKNEINVANVNVHPGEQYMEWVFKYGWTNS
jgi:hypothetical protein